MPAIVSLECPQKQFFSNDDFFFHPSFVGLSERVQLTDYRTDISEYWLETAFTTESEILDADVNNGQMWKAKYYQAAIYYEFVGLK